MHVIRQPLLVLFVFESATLKRTAVLVSRSDKFMRASIEQLIIQLRRLFTQFTLNIKEHVTIVLYCAHIYSHKIFAQQESQSSHYSKEKEK